MDPCLTLFEPQPDAAGRPGVLHSPFDVADPHPLTVRAAGAVMARLRAGELAPGVSTDVLRGPDGGKMFGVLVVETPDGRVGFLQALSGQLQRSWDIEGFVPPVFDRAARETVEARGELVVKALTTRVDAMRAEPARVELEVRLAQLVAQQEVARIALRERHRQARESRRLERERLAAEPHWASRPGPREGREAGTEAATETHLGSEVAVDGRRPEPLDTRTALRALDQLSRADDVEERLAKAAWRVEREALARTLHRARRRLAALERLRRIVSRRVCWQLYDTYVFENARGHRRSLRALFEPVVPSSGTGDCAAPKLLVYAARHGLRPLGLLEFWWGGPPLGGGRVEGAFYPACRDKCGPLLPFLLYGLEVRPSRRHRPRDVAADELRVVLEDPRFVVVEKPEGLLSVPGTDATVTDSVLARLRARYPAATGPLLVHRLDLETSGLLLAALDEEAYVALQRQFLERTVEKRYIALLDGLVAAASGRIELPLRVDLEQRPRQVVDFEHGKAALTEFTVLERHGGRTRLAFFPKTGRTHQLRVHAAHAQGLGLPIVGDRLYGRPERRLMLHAQELRFRHPQTGALVAVTSPVPF